MSTAIGGNPVPIEPVSYEVLEWHPAAPEMYSRAEVTRQTGPYEAAIPASISGWEALLSGEDQADVEDSTRQLVHFATYAQRLLGADSSAVGPMSAILLRTESASSSQIEQLTTSARQLALAEIRSGDKAHALTVVGNVRAMEAALRLADTVSETSILAMHRALMLHQPSFDPAEAGHFRREQVWIGPGNAGPRTATFVAPHHSRIANGMTDLVRFVQRDDVSVLSQVAVAHAQFETIHPFSDGNGRTGRALAQSILRNKGLVALTTLPISAGLLVDVDRYFAALGAFRAGDAGPIIREFAMAGRVAAVTGTKLVDSLAAELNASREKLRGVRSDAAAWKVLPLLLGQPVVNAQYLTRVAGLGEMAALRALDLLAAREVLIETTGKRRSRVWQHEGILGVLDEYAAAIRRMPAR